MKPFFRKHGWRYLPGILLVVLSSWINTRAPLALASAIDMATSAEWAAFVDQVLKILWIALGVFFTRFGWRYFIIGTSRELEIYMRDSLFDHLAYLPVRFYGENRSGDLMAYAINDVGMVRMLFGMVIAQVLNASGTILFSVTEMGTISLSLSLIALAPVPIAVVIVVVLSRKIQARSRRVQELFASVSGHVQENINGMRVLKAFAQEKAQYEAFRVESDEKRLANMKLYNTGNLLHPLIQIVFGISYMVGIIYGGRLVIEGAIQLSDYIAFNTFLTYIVFPVTAIGRISNMLQRGIASYKRLNVIMQEPENDEFDRDDSYELGSFGLHAENLSYTYPDALAPALDGVSFDLPVGSVLGIAGPTGSGKSTLMMLITKLLIPERGQLRINEEDILDIPAASIRKVTGYVPQDGFMFNESIYDNINFFTGASEEEIMSAVEAAGLKEDIDNMPEGMSTLAGERGNHLSGGQKQRASLARALVRNPQLLLLDDTLSAVDAHTEARILKSLGDSAEGRTAVIVSHKLSALRHADNIIYMIGGRIVEQGTHDELMALGGEYAAVYRTQMEEAEG